VGAIVAAVAGAMVLGLSDAADVVFPRAAFGNALALSAAFLIAVYLLIGRVVRQRTSFLAYVFPLYSVVAATCLIAALVLGTPLAQPAPVLLLCLAMAVFPQIVGHGSWNYAVRYLPAALLGLLSLSEPVLATLMAAVLFGEIPSLASAVCMAVILAAIAMVFARRKA
jgi:drug/metabolite transporter (DMT)-like permease